jgi:hypothetical protein
VKRPGLWLLLILAVGLGTRLWLINAPLKQDEFGPLYAVAGRTAAPGMLPAESDPLRPVSSWGEVADRSVLPFGIRNPLPLYNWLLYAVVHVLPIAEWSLRLPSLLAGLGCIVGVYLLCRRLLGEQVALVAALLAALDPMQSVVSVMVRPYALGNLACVLSFWALLGILYGRSTASRTGRAVGYGVTMALQGYLNPVLLLVGVGHVGILIYWWLGRPHEEAASASLRAQPGWDEEANPSPWAFEKAPPRSLAPLLYWLGGCALAVVLMLPEALGAEDLRKLPGGRALAAVLLLPEVGYLREIQAFESTNHDYLSLAVPRRGMTFLSHNSTFLVTLLAVSLAGYALRQMNAPATEEEAAAGGAGPEAAPAAGAAPAAAEGDFLEGREQARTVVPVTTRPDSAVQLPNDQMVAAAPPDDVASQSVRRIHDNPHQPLRKSPAEAAPAPAEPSVKKEEVPAGPAPAENPDLVWLGRCWLFLPQLAVVLLAYGLDQRVLLSRYLTYVGLGGAVLIAYYATRDRLKDVRLGVIGVAVLATALMLFPTEWSLGWGLITPFDGYAIHKRISELEERSQWRSDDVLLYRPSFLEADLLPDRVPEANRAQLEGVLAAPLTTLYVGKDEHPYVLLSYSHRRDDTDHFTLQGGLKYDPKRFYTPELAQKLSGYSRYLVATGATGRQAFLACLLPWLANTQDCYLTLIRDREAPKERYVLVPPGVGPGDQLPGLSNDVRPTDLLPIVVVKRTGPRACLSLLGAGGALGGPNGHVTLPVDLAVQEHGVFPPLAPPGSGQEGREGPTGK